VLILALNLVVSSEEERKRGRASECVRERFILVSTFTHSVCVCVNVPTKIGGVSKEREKERKREKEKKRETLCKKCLRKHIYTHTTVLILALNLVVSSEEEKKRGRASECERFILVSTFTHSRSARFCPNS